MNIKCAIEVKGIPDYASQYPYWIITVSENQAWFQAAYKRIARAEEEAKKYENGLVISSLKADYD